MATQNATEENGPVAMPTKDRHKKVVGGRGGTTLKKAVGCWMPTETTLHADLPR